MSGRDRQVLAGALQPVVAVAAHGEAAVRDSLGYIHHLGDHRRASACYRHALRLFRQLGSRYSEACTLDRLADCAHGAGDDATARRACQLALVIFDELNQADAGRVRGKLAGFDPLGGPESSTEVD